MDLIFYFKYRLNIELLNIELHKLYSISFELLFEVIMKKFSNELDFAQFLSHSKSLIEKVKENSNVCQ